MGNVLIVDDSSTMRKIISRSLRQAGLQVDDIYEAADGIEGLSTMEGKTISLILSDINMPNMDGLEFIKCVRAKGVTVLPGEVRAGGWYARPSSCNCQRNAELH